MEKGALDLRVGRKTWSVVPGQWVFLAPFQRRDQKFQEGTVLRSLRFQFPDPLYWRGFYPVRVETPDWAERTRLLALSDSVLELAPVCGNWQQWAERQELGFRWMKDWMALMEDQETDAELTQAEKLVGLMLNRLGKTEGLGVDYGELGQISGWSRSQIDRQFRGVLGTTPRKWLEQKLLREVEYALTTTTEPLKSLAYRYGFADPAHFTHWFKALTGNTPGQFREGA